MSTTTTATRAEEVRRERRRRKGSAETSGLKLHVDGLDNANFAYRFVNDDPARVRQMEANDYDIAPGNITRYGGLNGEGKPHDMILMRKHRDWYDEDQREKQDRLKAIEDQMKAGKHKTTDDVADTAEASSYTPGTGRNTIRRPS